MAHAYCENEDCEKDSWWLQKPPDEYASGGPKCPDCGTTRVSMETPPEPSEAQQSGPETRPAKPQAQQENAHAGSMRTREDAVQTGAQAGQFLAEMSASTPEEKVERQEKMFTAAGAALASIGQQMASERRESMERSKQADESNIGVVEDYVTCPECGTQITDLPPAGTQFRCPGCSQLLESQ